MASKVGRLYLKCYLVPSLSFPVQVTGFLHLLLFLLHSPLHAQLPSLKGVWWERGGEGALRGEKKWKRLSSLLLVGTGNFLVAVTVRGLASFPINTVVSESDVGLYLNIPRHLCILSYCDEDLEWGERNVVTMIRGGSSPWWPPTPPWVYPFEFRSVPRLGSWGNKGLHSPLCDSELPKRPLREASPKSAWGLSRLGKVSPHAAWDGRHTHTSQCPEPLVS